MTELLSYELVMNMVDEYEGNNYYFEYYPIEESDGYLSGRWVEMSHYKEKTPWSALEPSEWELFLEE